MVNLLEGGIMVPVSFDKFKAVILVNKDVGPKYYLKVKDTNTSIHKIIISEKKEHVKWDKAIFY